MLNSVVFTPALKNVWKSSRDNTARAGVAGVDNQSARQFAANLDHNINVIERQIKLGSYGFAPLKPFFIEKSNSEKDRMICVPTVRDRLVQRMIAEYLLSRELLPIYNVVSFGFIPGRGTRNAISEALKLRAEYDWCLKTDIVKFFDEIPRDYLKRRLGQLLRDQTLVSLISKVIDCEIGDREWQRSKREHVDVKKGVGLRQGMPLSPILANLALSEFDAEVCLRNLPMIRYADDLLFFFKTERELLEGEKVVRELLGRIKLTIPSLTLQRKTEKIPPKQPVDFLGRQLTYSAHKGHVACVSAAQIQRIRTRLSKEYSLGHRMRSGKNFQQTNIDVSRSFSAYLGIYSDVENFKRFESELRGEFRRIETSLFKDIFGEDVLGRLDKACLEFLGIGKLNLSMPCCQLED